MTGVLFSINHTLFAALPTPCNLRASLPPTCSLSLLLPFPLQFFSSEIFWNICGNLRIGVNLTPAGV